MQTRVASYHVPRWAFWAASLAGIAAASPSPFPGFALGNWPRITDLLNLACAGMIALTVLRAGEFHRSVRGFLVVWAMTTPWAFMEIYALGGAPDLPVQRLLIRWILCGFSAYIITAVVEQSTLRWRFMFGLLAGVMLSLMSVYRDSISFSPTDVPIEDLVNIAIYNGKDIYDFVYRASGVFGHPNGAAGCLLLGVPVMLGAIEEGRWPRWSIVLAIALMGVTFYFTKSRGPLAMAAVLVAYWLWVNAHGIRLPLVLAALTTFLAVLMAGDISGNWSGEVLFERFLDLDSIAVNASDRWWTIATSIELVLRNPLGMGSAYVAPLEIATGTSATHSAYLELALMGGLPLAAFVFFRLFKVAALLSTSWRPVETWLAAYLIGIFAFESYFQQMTIQLMTLWVVLSPARFLLRAGNPTTVASEERPQGSVAPGRPAQRELSA